MAEIKSCELWNRTPFLLRAGTSYRFSATGTWKDWSIECDATGYESFKLRPFERLRRMRHARWFSLIGVVDKAKETCFDIGLLIESGGTYTAAVDGTLFCFANDVSFMYWNNSGVIDLEVIEVAG